MLISPLIVNSNEIVQKKCWFNHLTEPA